MEAGGNRIRAYPKLPALALELWSLATALEHPTAALLCYAAGMYIAYLLVETDKSPPKTFFDQLLKATRWDISGALVRGIVREQQTIQGFSMHLRLVYTIGPSWFVSFARSK
ncbi:hypothetical protein PQX77_011873 [Marasmius sp. AFHP31]|nr:hypothetical protein PQX77_011873 [Marasmius sp. AFHP31]